jgi:hypothetical protein
LNQKNTINMRIYKPAQIFIFIISLMMTSNGLIAQQQESYTFCTGGSYSYLLDTTTTSTSSYYARWTTASTGYSAHFQKDTIYQSISGGSGAGGHGGVKKWACTSTTAATAAWTYSMSNAHHDICPLPNGNVLVIVSESKTSSQISAVGGSYSGTATFETIQEIHPTGSTTGTVVWQWKLFDHVCQSTNTSVTSTYVSSISANPQLFNLALVTSSDFFHLNGIDYNPELDQIVFSSHMLNEIFIIDHSTTTAQAATHAGGNAGKGGDFLYRWGSPDNYGLSATGNGVTLNVIHDVRWVPSTNQDYPNYISMFHNGGCSSGKGIVLFLPPHNGYNYTYTLGSVIGPTSATTPTTPSFTVSNQGGAMVCENGNILITNPGTKFYECSGAGTTYQQITVSTIQSDRLKKCEVLGPFPTATASTTSVCVGTAFTLNSSATAPLQTSPSYTYSWSTGASTQSTSVTPTAAGANTYTVTVTSGGCSNTASVSVTANAAPTANAGNDVTISSGSSTTLTATGGGTYAWNTGGSTASITVSPTTTTTYTVTVTSGGCTASDNVTVTVSAGTLSVTTTATPNAVCSGTSTQLTATPTGGSTYTYSWSSSPAGFTSTSQTPTVAPTVNTTYTVTVTSSGNTATSNITVTVYSLPVANAGNDAAICNGSSTNLTASGGTGYAWNTGGNTATITVSPTITSTYTVTVTDAHTCTATDAVIVTVNSTVAASNTIIANPTGAICTGSSVTFTASATNGGASPTYQWKNNGTNITGATNSTYTSSSLTNGNIITCAMISNLGCVTGSPATSNAITMSVNSNVTASVSIAANPTGSICAGTSVTFTATASNGGTSPTYQWQINSSNISGATNSTYTSTMLSNSDVVTCIMASNLICATGSPATSNTITMSVNSSVAAGITISANPAGAICTGTNVTFTAAPSNGGATPGYQWKINGSNISGATNSTYASASLVNNDAVTCVMTSNASCVSGSPATSNAITMQVNSALATSVNISVSPSSTICNGSSVTFTATAANGGATPVYQWQLNGSIVGTNSSTYTTSAINNGDVIQCILTSSNSCATGSPTNSNQIAMTIASSLTASISIATNTSPVCEGQPMTFTTSPQNGGSSPVYQWQVNGANVGSNSTTYTSSTLLDGDIITCLMVSSESCSTGSPATSNLIIADINPIPQTPVISQNGNTLTSSVASGNQWYYQNLVGDLLISGATGQTYVPIVTGEYYTIATGNGGCMSDTSNIIYMIITGIDELINSQVNIFPNPTNGIIHFDYSIKGQSVTVSICNVLGETLIEKENPTVIDLSVFENGTYFLICKIKDTYSSSKKIILLK